MNRDKGALTIRAYRDEDRDAVVGLWRACNLVMPWNDPDADIALCRANTNALLMVGTLADTVVASVMAGQDGHRGWFYYLAVDPVRQRQGHGRSMVAAAEDWLAARNLPKAQLMVRATNPAAVEFYKRLGYETTTLMVMQRWLRDPPNA